MWTQKLLSVLVLVSISQAHSLHQQKISNENEDDKPDGLYVLQDADDARRAFVVTRESTPNSMKMNAGFQLFEIPIGPQFSYSREKEVNEVDPTATRKEPAKSGWKYFPFSRAFTDDNNEENDQDEVVQVPAGKLKQQQNVGIIQARDADSGTFPWGIGVRSAGNMPDDRNRRDDGDFPWGIGVRSAGNMPDDRNRRDDGTFPWGIGVRSAGNMPDDRNRRDDGDFPWGIGVRSAGNMPDDRNRRDDGTFPWGIGVRSAGNMPDDRNRRDDGDFPWGIGVRSAGNMPDDRNRRDDGTFPWGIGVRSAGNMPDDRNRRDDGDFPWGIGVRSAGNMPDDRNRRDDGEFPWGIGVRSAGAMPDDELPKNELATDRLSAGLQIFGLPLGPQFSYNSNKEDDGSGNKGDVLTSLLAPLLTNIAKRWVAEYILG